MSIVPTVMFDKMLFRQLSLKQNQTKRDGRLRSSRTRVNSDKPCCSPFLFNESLDNGSWQISIPDFGSLILSGDLENRHGAREAVEDAERLRAGRDFVPALFYGAQKSLSGANMALLYINILVLVELTFIVLSRNFFYIGPLCPPTMVPFTTNTKFLITKVSEQGSHNNIRLLRGEDISAETSRLSTQSTQTDLVPRECDPFQHFERDSLCSQ